MFRENKRKFNYENSEESVKIKRLRRDINFCDVPMDILKYMIYFFDLNDLYSFLQTSKRNYYSMVGEENKIFEALTKKTFWVDMEPTLIWKQVYKNLLKWRKKPYKYDSVLLEDKSLFKDTKVSICEIRMSKMNENLLISGGDAHEGLDGLIQDPLILWDISRMSPTRLISNHPLWMIASGNDYIFTTYGSEHLKKTKFSTLEFKMIKYPSVITGLLLYKNFVITGHNNGKISYFDYVNNGDIVLKEINDLSSHITSMDINDKFLILGTSDRVTMIKISDIFDSKVDGINPVMKIFTKDRRVYRVKVNIFNKLR
jgi:hypothetical protein